MSDNLDPVQELFNKTNSTETLKFEATSLKSWDLTKRQICDLELLMNGSFSPLKGFLGKEDYERVLHEMRLQNGALWPMPITLDVDKNFAEGLQPNEKIALRDQEGTILATLEVTDNWAPNKNIEANKIFGSNDLKHPGVDYLFNTAGDFYLGGSVIGIKPPVHYDFINKRYSPNGLKKYFKKMGWKKIIAFQTRSLLHRAQQELTLKAAKNNKANLLIHPVVGMTKPGEIDHFTKVRCYNAVLNYYPSGMTELSLLSLAMRMAGPREAIWHGLIRKNHGCTHLILAEDEFGPNLNTKQEPFYDPHDTKTLFHKHQAEMGIKMVDFESMVYVKELDRYEPIEKVTNKPLTKLDISGRELGKLLDEGLEIPNWFSFPEVISELRKVRPARELQGFTIFFTGLSGSGKSTIANVIMTKLMELGGRPVTLLDGDIVRKNLSSELGFSKNHRDINIRRIGYVASEITKNGGIAICAPIAPYSKTRKLVRDDIETWGTFIEVHIATSIAVCERRDRKGLYKLAREGKIKEFTGISDPYESPQKPELRIETENVSVETCAQQIMVKLESLGLVKV